MRKLYYSTIIFLFAVYIGLLFYSGKLNFYINPRYTEFTYAMGLVAVIFGGMGIIHVLEARGWLEDKLSWREFLASLLLVGTLAVGILLPVQRLSVATASQRELDFNSVGAGRISAADLFIQNTRAYDLGDWISSMSYNPDEEFYIGKQVDVSGFIFPRDQSDSGHFTVARFIVTCCAVDATPVGLLVAGKWQDGFSQNDWVRVEGTFALQEVAGQEELVVVAENITIVPEPAIPYIF
jgi:uncharacterized repeat protein (TIGR03943 family)